ncbi:UNVERIFIED_CONTAM: hypothetical protein K2H54_020672 [Gekko kuhli]
MATQFLKEIENADAKKPSEMRTLVIKWIEKLFPEVQSVGTETLQRWMEEKPEELLILRTEQDPSPVNTAPGLKEEAGPDRKLTFYAGDFTGRGKAKQQDIRTAAEFEVSHLPGAILAATEGHALQEFLKAQLMQEHDRGRRCIICYCTVGYRSSIAAQLANEILPQVSAQKSATSFDVYNVQGGLVKWATERRRMVNHQETPTQVVHPYSPVWSKLLEPEFKAEI